MNVLSLTTKWARQTCVYLVRKLIVISSKWIVAYIRTRSEYAAWDFETNFLSFIGSLAAPALFSAVTFSS